MLNIIEYGKDEYSYPSLLVLGCFDAIHAGHRELFKKAKLQAKINGLDLGVMMFREGKGGKLVYSFEERVAMLEPYNVKFVLVIDYNPEFKQTMPLDFLAAIEEKINVKGYMSGKDFRFGKGTKGKSSTLKNYAEDEENGVWYMPLKDVMCDGEKISTTLIKSCLDEGNVSKAAKLLGEPFYVEGVVEEGAHRGTGVLGFPTVNITYPDWKYPVKHGVYKVAVTIDGQKYSGIANFGDRPTFDDDREILEVHIKDFEGDLYGKTVKVGFEAFMRGIYKFSDAEALAAQLEQDKAALSLSEEQFNAIYPLPDEAPAIVEEVTAELESESQPLPEVFEGAPAEQPEAEIVTEQAEEPAPEEETVVEESATEPADETAEVVEETPEETTEPAPEGETVVEECITEPAEELVEVVEEASETDGEPVSEEETVVEESVTEPAEETTEVVEETPEVTEEPAPEEETVVEECTTEPAEETAEVVEESSEVTEEPAPEEETVVEESITEPAEETTEAIEAIPGEIEQPASETEEQNLEQTREEETEEIIEAEVSDELTPAWELLSEPDGEVDAEENTAGTEPQENRTEEIPVESEEPVSEESAEQPEEVVCDAAEEISEENTDEGVSEESETQSEESAETQPEESAEWNPWSESQLEEGDQSEETVPVESEIQPEEQ